MTSVVFHGNNKFTEFTYNMERDFEQTIESNTKLLFGASTIYIDLKARTDTVSLGASVPDGLLFDLRDIENPEFYLVEIELAKHDFYKHIFPQITKFFAFFRNPKGQNDFVERTFSVIQADKELEKEFKHYLEGKEIFKFIKDTIENSQNILLVIDEMKPQLPEMVDTYAEWSKMVKILVLKEYRCGENRILSLTPDFEGIELGELPVAKPEEIPGKVPYTEEYHLDGVDSKVKAIYQTIQSRMLDFKTSLRFNPQKYYISIVDKKNFAYIYIRKKKIRITIMLEENTVRTTVKHHKVVSEAESVCRFYGGGDCCTVIIEDGWNLDEVIGALKIPVMRNLAKLAKP